MPSPKDPNKYLGPNVYTGVDVIRNRPPGLPDYRQPETGRNYELMTIWQVSKDPSSGTEGDLWILSKIVANQGYWIQIGSGVTPSGAVLSLSDTADTLVYPEVAGNIGNIQLEGTAGISIISDPGSHKLVFALTGGGGAIDSIDVQSATAPGVDPVTPTAGGLMTISGASVASHAVPIETHTRALNAFNIEVQLASEQAASSQTNAGLASFSNAQFDVDASGFVTLLGSTGPATTKFDVQTATAPGVDPVTPTVTGVVTVNGSLVAAHSVPLETHTRALNAFNIEAQVASAVAPTPANTNSAGMACFNNTQFTVDATSAMVGLTVMPLFSAKLITSVTNVTGDATPYAVICESELFDIGGNYDTATGLFTAPSDGVYQFFGSVPITSVGAAHDLGRWSFVATGQVIEFNQLNPGAVRNSANNCTFSGSAIMSLTAGQTVYLQINVAGSTLTIGVGGSATIVNSPYAYFQGYKLRQ